MGKITEITKYTQQSDNLTFSEYEDKTVFLQEDNFTVPMIKKFYTLYFKT